MLPVREAQRAYIEYLDISLRRWAISPFERCRDVMTQVTISESRHSSLAMEPWFALALQPTSTYLSMSECQARQIQQLYLPQTKAGKIGTPTEENPLHIIVIGAGQPESSVPQQTCLC
jgi:hypothetical protein